MRLTLIPLVFVTTILASCNNKGSESVDVRSRYGNFGDTTIKWKPVDYTQTPVYKSIKHHPENYGHLEMIDVYSMAHLSDSLLVTGFIVAPKKKGKYPVVIFNRGGNQEMGRLVVKTAIEIMGPIAAQGYVVAATNYRGNSGSEGKEQFGGNDVNDIKNLIKSMSEFEMADTDKVGLFGLSRGGMMSFLTLKENDEDLNIKAAAVVGAITDLELTIKYHPTIEEVCQELIPDYETNPVLHKKKRSAVNWVNELSPDIPLLVLHGTEDQHVDYLQIPVFADSLDKYQIPYKLVSFHGDNHGITNNRETGFKMVFDWFEKYVKEEREFQEDSIRVIIR